MYTLFLLLATTASASLVLEPWGYHMNTARNASARFTSRWSMISAEIENDINSGNTRFDFSAMDYGSNEGYFSVSIAHQWKRAQVVSMDPNTLYHDTKVYNADRHRMKMRQYNVTNNYLCERSMDSKMFHTLVAGNQRAPVFDYTLMLSVFHWLPLENLTEFRYTLVEALRTSRTTFLELPEGGHKSSANYKYFSRWYDQGADIRQVILDAAAERNVSLRVVCLGVSTIDYGAGHALTTTRTLYRVDFEGPLHRDIESVPHPLSCIALNRTLACARGIECARIPPCDVTPVALSPFAQDTRKWSAESIHLTNQAGIIKLYKHPFASSFILAVRHGYESALERLRAYPGLIATPSLTCIRRDGVLLQTQPLAGNLPFTTYAKTTQRKVTETLRLALDISCAVALAHHHRVAVRDLHPGQFVVQTDSLTARMVDLDTVGYVHADDSVECKCMKRGELSGGMLPPPPEASYGKCTPGGCTLATDVYLLGETLAYLVDPTIVQKTGTFREDVLKLATTPGSSLHGVWLLVYNATDPDQRNRPSSAHLTDLLLDQCEEFTIPCQPSAAFQETCGKNNYYHKSLR